MTASEQSSICARTTLAKRWPSIHVTVAKHQPVCDPKDRTASRRVGNYGSVTQGLNSCEPLNSLSSRVRFIGSLLRIDVPERGRLPGTNGCVKRLKHLLECKGPNMSKFRDFREPSQGRGNISGVASAVVFVLLIGAIGAYLYETGTWNPIKYSVSDKEIPSAPLLHLPSHTPRPTPQ
jgi:hypothetical protein